MSRDDIQTNLRLPPETYAVLEAIAFVEDAGSVQKLLKQLIDDATAQYAQLPTIQKAIEARKEHRAAAQEKVKRLPARHNL